VFELSEGAAQLLLWPFSLGAIAGRFLGYTAGHGRRVARARHRYPAYVGLLGGAIGGALGWLLGQHLFEPVLLCARPVAYSATTPHSLAIAPIGAAVAALAAMLCAAGLRGGRSARVLSAWTLCWGIPVSAATLLGKSTTSADALLEGCASVGPRIVAIACLLGCVSTGSVVVAWLQRRAKRRHLPIGKL